MHGCCSIYDFGTQMLVNLRKEQLGRRYGDQGEPVTTSAPSLSHRVSPTCRFGDEQSSVPPP